MKFPSIVCALTLLLASACGPSSDPTAGQNWADSGPGDDDPFNPDPNNPPAPDPDAAQQCTKMDILFVVDDSGSMSQEQSNLATNFPQFAQVIEDYRTEDGEALDYRLAVTTTGRDLDYVLDPGIPPFPPIPSSERGDNGEFRQGAGMTRRWLEKTDPNVVSTFSQIAQVGTSGPSIEMPLLAIEWALDDRVADGTNAGFLRDDALLATVILTDEDDCSREDNNFTVANDACSDSIPEILSIDHYINFLDDLKEERGRWATAVIAGPTSCTSELGDAIEARRLKDFVAQTGENAVFSSICEGDLASALNDALATFDSACQAFPPID